MKEPELVFSGLIFLVPAYVAWYDGREVSAAAITANLLAMRENEKTSLQT